MGPWLHTKAPWQDVTVVSMMEQSLDLAGETGGRTAMAEDGTILRFDSILRYVPVEGELSRFLRPPAPRSNTGLFTCLLRNEIANFRAPASTPRSEGAFDFALQAGSYAVIRRERQKLNEHIEQFCREQIGGRYGVRFNAVDLTDILPPDEIADGLNAVIHASTEAETRFLRAEGECHQRLLASEKGVDIARARASAIETEIRTLSRFSELHKQGTLGMYIARRRAEVLSSLAPCSSRRAREPNLSLALGVALGLALVPSSPPCSAPSRCASKTRRSCSSRASGASPSASIARASTGCPRARAWCRRTSSRSERTFAISRTYVNDARGTTVTIDLWLEVRIADPVKALFQVSDWDHALQNLVSHAATSILGNREFKQILCDRTELGEVLRRDISQETARWGLAIEQVYIRNVKLLPEVSRQIFETVAARLERARADIEEAGRLAVAQLEADTSVRVASMVAEAKAQYPLAVGRALDAVRADPAVLDAYNELYALSLVRPHRTIAFKGFEGEALRAVDAAMLAPVIGDAEPHHAPASPIAPLNGSDHRRVDPHAHPPHRAGTPRS
ncbi:MAG: SPFH domain-containing protein [Polyangiales bacterium]